MGRKAIGPVCCVTHVKEPSALIEKKKGVRHGVPGLIGGELRHSTLYTWCYEKE